MENIIFSSCNDRKTLNEKNKLDNDTKVELVSVKSELVDIKKEPNSSSYNTTSLLKNNMDDMELVNTDHKMLESTDFEAKNISTNMQTEKSILKIKKEKGLGIYKELDEQSMSEHDVKQEPMDPDSSLELMEDNRSFDGTCSTNNEEKFTENSIEFLEQNESFDENPESEFKFTETNMFGISEMFNFISDEVIKCKYCNFETKHKNQLWGHMQVHNDSLDLKSQEVILYKCPFPECNFQTVYKYSVSKHYNTHKTQKYKCSKCSYTTLQLKKYEQHIKSCEKLPEGTLLQCDKCDYKVKTQGLLLVHKRRHKDESRLLKCTECDMTTMHPSALKKHMEKHQRQEENNFFTCTKCSYKSPSKMMLMRHEKVHGKEEEDCEGKYQCSDCNFQTLSLDELESHMVEHKGEKSGEPGTVESSSKMFYCQECSFKTSVESKARHHIKLHIRQRNGEIYKCESCKYETMHKYLLKRHSLKHKDKDSVETYPCDLCDYRAKMKDYLIRHKRTHMKKELQQYKCTVCLFETIYKHTFKEHLARHNISLVDVKKFLSDKPEISEGSSALVSEEVVELQNVLKDIAPADGGANLGSEET